MEGMAETWLEDKGCEHLKHFGTIISFIFFVLFGVMAGSHLNANIRVQDENFNPAPSSEVQSKELVELQRNNEELKLRIEALAAEVDAYEKEWASENIVLKKLINDVNQYKMLSGHLGVNGPGISIVLQGIGGENIADIMEREKYLITLVNELRFFEAEAIAINGQRLTSRSEIVKAGNHINVNGVPIAPPYQIDAIGNVRMFQRYVEHGTFLFEVMQTRYGITTTIYYPEELNIPPLTQEKPLEFLKSIEENNSN